jgi:hypothetical protein
VVVTKVTLSRTLDPRRLARHAVLVASACVAAPWPAVATPMVPASVQAGEDGSFQYDAVFIVDDPAGVDVAGIGFEAVDNVEPHQMHGDGFCDIHLGAGERADFVVTGRLIDVRRAGRIESFFAPCDAPTERAPTIIEPSPAIVGPRPPVRPICDRVPDDAAARARRLAALARVPTSCRTGSSVRRARRVVKQVRAVRRAFAAAAKAADDATRTRRLHVVAARIERVEALGSRDGPVGPSCLAALRGLGAAARTAVTCSP